MEDPPVLTLLEGPPCANIIEHSVRHTSNCVNKAQLTCNHCHLVKYCGKQCQVQHWPAHKSDCKKSSLAAESWRPQWIVERRTPTFISDGLPAVPFAATLKYIWGNVPAFDVLRIETNEGSTYHKDINICFAASGDLRNLIRTVVSLPEDFSGVCNCVVNDRDEDIVARNILILLLAFSLAPEAASPAILHLWYSATLPNQMLEKIISTVKPLISDVCAKIKDKKGALQAKIWEFGTTKLRVVLTKEQWQGILARLNRPFKMETSEKMRKEIVLAPSRIDFLDRKMACLEPFARVSAMHLRKTGVVAALGTDLSDFDTPNPTLFGPKGEWMLPDSASPLDGWHLPEIVSSGYKAGYPNNDLVGAMACHVLGILRSFCTRARNTNISIQAYQIDARKLPEFVEVAKFDRIEVSNLIDGGWLGVDTVLRTFGLLLRSKTDNPCASIVGYFLNAVPEIEASRSKQLKSSLMTAILKAKDFIPISAGMSPTNPVFTQFMSAKDMFLDFDGHFEEYMKTVDLKEVNRSNEMRMRNQNTIIKKWPYRLEEKPGTHAAKREFNLLQISSLTGFERFVEWVRL